jgi:phospholipase C
MQAPPTGSTALTVYGPNGFLRRVRGRGSLWLEVTSAVEADGSLRLRVRNGEVAARDESNGRGQRQVTLGAGGTEELLWCLHDSPHWYDLTVSTEHYQWRVASHVEDGQEGVSDPANLASVLAELGSSGGGRMGTSTEGALRTYYHM